MAQRTFNSIEDAKKYLIAYKKDIPNKSKILVERLADRGILVANVTASSTGMFGSHKMHERVTFLMKELDVNKYGAKAILVGQGTPFVEYWDNQVRVATVYPMHMIEFGTGIFFDEERADEFAVKGRGRHNTSSSWFFIDENGHLKKGTAIKPTKPLYFAWQQMVEDYVTIAREVWKS